MLDKCKLFKPDGIADGGAAFPLQSVNPCREPDAPNYGMSLRDYIAIHMASAFIAKGGWGDYETLCSEAYVVADAMLAARDGGAA